MQHSKLFVTIGLILALALAGLLFWRSGSLAIPAADKTPAVVPPGMATSSLGLTLPTGFSISVLTDKVPGARVLVEDSFGNLWVSQPSEGIVSTIEMAEDGTPRVAHAVFRNMNKPHGLALDPLHPFAFYIAEEDKISRVGLYSDSPMEKIADLPAGGRHTSRTIGFSSDGRLYVSIGSSCDVCREDDNWRAKILSMEADGRDIREFASGLRNAVFFAFHPKTGKMWATEMGRDHLGDDLPPDEINIVESGKNYGWPICYGKNIHDTDFDKNTYIRNPCQEPFETPSLIDLPAHSAPLGLTFLRGDGWPDDYQNDLLVAYHGSWNRSEPTGYKIIRFRLDENGNPEGGAFTGEDFIAGWLSEDGEISGRPVGLLAREDGVLYITDDKSGKIYQVEYRGE